MLTQESFVAHIDAFLKRTDMSPTAFGKAAVGDGNFVRDLRDGRMPSLRLVERVDDYIRNQDRSAPAVSETAQ